MPGMRKAQKHSKEEEVDPKSAFFIT